MTHVEIASLPAEQCWHFDVLSRASQQVRSAAREESVTAVRRKAAEFAQKPGNKRIVLGSLVDDVLLSRQRTEPGRLSASQDRADPGEVVRIEARSLISRSRGGTEKSEVEQNGKEVSGCVERSECFGEQKTKQNSLDESVTEAVENCENTAALRMR